MELDLFKNKARDLLGEIEKAVPFIEDLEIEFDCRLASGLNIDLLADFRVNGQSLKLLGAIKSQLQPRHVYEVVRQLKEKGSSPFAETSYPLILSEFISPRVSDILKDLHVSYFDLCGNCWLSFSSVYIEKSGKKHKALERRELKSLFSLKSSRMIRLLLRNSQLMWQVEALSKSTKLSLGQVSNIRRALLDQKFAQTNEGGISLVKPEELLISYALSYKKNVVKQKLNFYTLLSLDEMQKSIIKAMAESKKTNSNLMFSGLSAARYQAPFLTFSSETFYADKDGIECLKDHLKLVPVNSGSNIVVSEPKDSFVFEEAEESATNIFCSNSIQTYLDLFSAGEREKEAAEHLLNHTLKNSWKKIRG